MRGDDASCRPAPRIDACSPFLSSADRSGLVRAGHDATSVHQLAANSINVYTFDLSPTTAAPTNFAQSRAAIPLVHWEVRQHKTAVDDWERAFEDAVRVRTQGAFRGVFLALSSGYDSGAIHLAMLRLRVPHATYSIVGAENKDDQAIIERRVAFAKALME